MKQILPGSGDGKVLNELITEDLGDPLDGTVVLRQDGETQSGSSAGRDDLLNVSVDITVAMDTTRKES